MWISTSRLIRIVILTISSLLYLTDHGDCDDLGGGADKISEADRNCSRFELSPILCRANHCTFTCADRNCIGFVEGYVCEPPPTIVGVVETNDGRNICPRDCHNVCECRKTASCQFDITGGNCRPAEFYAECRRDLFVQGECQYHGAYYIEGGLICRNSRSDGDCESTKQILAVNLNGDELYDATSGIKYSADVVIPYLDPFGSRVPSRVDGEVTGTTEQLKELYATYITGLKDVAKEGRCISYEIPLVEEGKYELIIKLGEFRYAEPNSRSFRMRFNKMDVVLELDLFQTIGADNHAADIILKFEIMQKNILWAKGFMPSVIQNGKTELSFCYGARNDVDTSYLVSAFAVVKYVKGAPPKPPPPDKCLVHSASKCNCKLNGCEFNSGAHQCKSRENYCNLWLKNSVCRKNGTFLVHGGVICPSKNDGGNCQMTKLVHAVNIHGVEHTDLEGIKYVADNVKLYEDPFGIRWNREERLPQPSDPCYIDGPVWKDLATIYYKIMTGHRDDSKRNPDHCTTYFITHVGDGRYLLTIKTMDFHELVNTHLSTIKLNNVEILPDVDITRQIARCKPTDFLINFQIKGTKLKIDGFAPVDLPGPGPIAKVEPLRLSFCYGTCTDTRIDTRYLASAFSVALLEPTNTTGECEMAGNFKIETCSDADFEVGQCRKIGKYYIGKNGLPCRNTRNGSCAVIEHVRAVNMNGDVVSDDEGMIRYIKDEPHLFKDPSNTRVPGVASGGVTDSPAPLVDLYKNFVSGKKDPGPGDKCLTYEIPIHIDGNYELILKLGEFEYDQAGRRSFKVKLNNMVFMPELDVFKLIGSKGRVADLVVQFSLANGTVLSLKGSADLSEVKGGKINVSFCYGSCDVQDRAYIMSGFALVRYTYTGPPIDGDTNNTGLSTVGRDPLQWPYPTHTNGSEPEGPVELCDKIHGNTTLKRGCICHRTQCEYAWDENLCVHQTKKCAEILPGVKCQRKGFFAQDAVICNMTPKDENIPDCNFEEVIKAVNVGGEDKMGDKDGILYNKETKEDYIYEYATKRRLESYQSTFDACKAQGNPQVKTGDSELYYTLAHGWSNKEQRKPENCLHYPIKIEKDGMYELGMKFIETYHIRDFSYFTGKLNNQTILSRFDMIVYSKDKCVGMDVYVHFRVSNGARTFRLHGRSKSSPIKNNEIRLTFCYGDRATDCIVMGDDPNYSISAFFVARFDPEDNP